MKNSISTFAFLFFLPCSLIGQSEGTAVDPVETRELIRQWVAAERLVSEEKAAWQVEQKRMQELLGLYQKELQLLDEELGKSGGAADLIDNDKDKLEVRVKKYRAAQGLLAKTMVRLLPRAQQLIAFFPQPLQDELSADIDALNTSDALSKSRDVLRSMISILTTAERFNRSVTLVEETRVLAGGKKISVDVIYLGLARAFYTAVQVMLLVWVYHKKTHGLGKLDRILPIIFAKSLQSIVRTSNPNSSGCPSPSIKRDPSKHINLV